MLSVIQIAHTFRHDHCFLRSSLFVQILNDEVTVVCLTLTYSKWSQNRPLEASQGLILHLCIQAYKCRHMKCMPEESARI